MSKARRKPKQQRGISPDSEFFGEYNRFARKVRNRIFELRQQHGLTQEQMQDFDIGVRQLQRLEAGDSSNLTLSYLFRLAKAFKTSPSELINV